MINYIVARKKNMTDGSIKYYAKVAPVSPVYVNDIAARISKTCTVTEHDVKAVHAALQEQVIYSLSDGHRGRQPASSTSAPASPPVRVWWPPCAPAPVAV